MKKRTRFKTVIFFCCIAILLTPAIVNAGKKERTFFGSHDQILREIPTKEKLVALSFDDGPNPRYTPQVLDLLKQYNAKATFFVIGSRVEKFKDLVQREVMEGHEVANHSYSHTFKRLSEKEFKEDLTKAQRAIYYATGQFSHLYRPPGGFYDEMIIHLAKSEGYIVVLWSKDTRDWSKPGVDKIVHQVLDHLHNGDIILFHDHGRDRGQTIKALAKILPELQAKGYHCVTISELLKTKASP
jgi:peptidoglycan-N-acetylglucosamine deacetylase